METLERYPAHREADVVLRDGSTVHIRPIRPDDEQKFLEFLRGLSEQSRTLRFFTPAVDLVSEAKRESHIDYRDRFGLVATAGADARIVGHASYAKIDSDRAEVAFTVDDHYQGRGLGTIMLGQLAEIAAEQGIRIFMAEVLPINARMLEVFRESGFPVEVQSRPHALEITFPTSLTPQAIEQFERREQIAAINALRSFLCPRSIAVIGASRQRGSVGGELFHNLLAYGFEGPVYPVNSRARVVQSVVAYPSVEVVPGPVDLAVIAVPAAEVVDVARQCGRKGVRALVVVSAGFAEAGEEGRQRQDELVRVCRAYGMRLIGPNCIGIVNTDPSVRLDAIFGPQPLAEGRVAFASQSGALGLAAIDYANALGLGISSFVSVGNKADISGNDLLSYWESDPRTAVILLYLESFGNPRKFTRIARRVAKSKPVIAVKSGRSVAGARATSSHTGALLASSDVTVDALFQQSGVIRTNTLEELFDVAALLATQPAPKGRRVGIVTNAGGPGILCADACEASGLEVPILHEETRRRLADLLPAEASLTNPVDMIATATAEQYEQVVRLVASDPHIDAVVAIFLPPLVTRAEDVAAAIVAAANALNGEKPIVSVFMSSHGVPRELRTAALQIPSYTFPESAAIALAHAARYGAWRQRPVEEPPILEGVQHDQAAALIASALGRGGGWLEPHEVAQLLACYGLPLVEQRLVATPDAAGAAAEELGGEVVLKGIAPGVVHKTEAGAVRLALRGRAEVQAAAERMAQQLALQGSPPTNYLVQRMVPRGVEMIVGIVADPQFGSVVACGAGGVLVELLRDVAIRLTPLTRGDAYEMIEQLKTAPLLRGFRGGPAADVEALVDILLRVGAMGDHHPEIAEFDANPVIVLERGAVIVDARVRVEAVPPPRPLGARR